MGNWTEQYIYIVAKGFYSKIDRTTYSAATINIKHMADAQDEVDPRDPKGEKKINAVGVLMLIAMVPQYQMVINDPTLPHGEVTRGAHKRWNEALPEAERKALVQRLADEHYRQQQKHAREIEEEVTRATSLITDNTDATDSCTDKEQQSK